MILIAQRMFTVQHVEALVFIPAERLDHFDVGVIVYDPKTQKLTEADPARCRHLGTFDMLTASRHALMEMARWSMTEDEVKPLDGFVARLDAFLGQLYAYASMDARWKETPVPV